LLVFNFNYTVPLMSSLIIVCCGGISGRDANNGGLRRTSSLYAGRGIFDHNAILRAYAKQVSCFQITFRCWFALIDIISRNQHLGEGQFCES
jgi:hypothetical protein